MFLSDLTHTPTYQSQVLVHSCDAEIVVMSEFTKFGVEVDFVSTLQFPEQIDDCVESPKYLIQQLHIYLSDLTRRIFTI